MTKEIMLLSIGLLGGSQVWSNTVLLNATFDNYADADQTVLAGGASGTASVRINNSSDALALMARCYSTNSSILANKGAIQYVDNDAATAGSSAPYNNSVNYGPSLTADLTPSIGVSDSGKATRFSVSFNFTSLTSTPTTKGTFIFALNDDKTTIGASNTLVLVQVNNDGSIVYYANGNNATNTNTNTDTSKKYLTIGTNYKFTVTVDLAGEKPLWSLSVVDTASNSTFLSLTEVGGRSQSTIPQNLYMTGGTSTKAQSSPFVDVDNIVIQTIDVPEPASLSVLGIPCLAMLAKRKY